MARALPGVYPIEQDGQERNRAIILTRDGELYELVRVIEENEFWDAESGMVTLHLLTSEGAEERERWEYRVDPSHAHDDSTCVATLDDLYHKTDEVWNDLMNTLIPADGYAVTEVK